VHHAPPQHREKVPVETLLPDLIQHCKDQNGSRTIQETFEVATDAEKQMLFEKMQSEIPNLMVDVFGNYVVQRFLEKGLPQHKEHIMREILKSLRSLSVHSYGCRVVQSMLDQIRAFPDIVDAFVQELDKFVLEAIHDHNGNHVVQKCIESIPAQKLQGIINAVV
jgi:pumilio RNA-binding family